MRKKEKAKRIGELLDHFYPALPAIPLHHKDSFTLLVAVLLSAQCTDARVNIVTEKLFALADTPEKMAKLSEEEIREAIQSLGLAATKAKNIRQLSRILIEKYNGAVPDTFTKLEALPGVGHKTASVVMVQAFGKPAFPVDTHIHRLAKRWGLSSGKNVETTERDLKRLFPKEQWGRRHLQIIYYARRYCPARGHNLEQCPICSFIAHETSSS
jgi:endonuclease-3